MAEAGSVWVSVIPSLRGFTAKVKSELRDLEITVDLDDGEARRRLSELRKQESQRDIQLKADVDTLKATRSLNTWARTAGKVSATVNVDADTGAAMTKLVALGAVARGAMITSIVAPTAIQGVMGLTSALAPAVGIINILPAAGAAGAVGVLTLKSAFTGFGDAVGDDPKKAAEAMAKMAPSAREAAVAVNGLKPAWHGLQLGVQSAMFAGLAGQISGLGRTYLPMLSGTLTNVAGGFNRAALGVSGWLASSYGISTVQTLLEGSARSVNNVTGAFAPLITAVVTIGAIGAPILANLTQGAGAVAGKFAAWVGSAQGIQTIQGWIYGAISVFQTLGGIVGNVGSILWSVFSAANATGGNFLNTLRMVTGELAAGLKSPAGAAGLTTFFSSMAGTVQAAMPGIRAIGTALLDIITNIAPALPSIGFAFSMIMISLQPFVSALSWLIGAILPPLMYALGFLSPALVPIAIGIGILVGVVKGWIAIQAILNGELWAMTAALLANPITWVIVAILALVGVVIYAWNNWTWFREAVIAAWQGIVTAAQWAWTTVLQPIFAFLGAAVMAVGNFFVWLWSSVIVPAWNAIGAVISWAWTTILQPIFSFIGTALMYLGIVVGTLLLAPFVIAWNLISALVSAVWSGVLQPIWYGAIVPALQFMGSVFTWLWLNVVMPAWNGIVAAVQFAWGVLSAIWYGAVVPALQFLGSIFSWLYTNIIIPVWSGIQAFIAMEAQGLLNIWNGWIVPALRVLGAVFTWLWVNIIQPVWNGIMTVISGAWNFIQGVFNVGKAAVQAVGQAFQSVADWVGRAWAAIREYARAPVQFVVDVVYNNGIRRVWNGIAGLFGMAQLGEVRFAEGGVLPGYTPGRDVIPAMLSGGEGILVPEAVRGLGAGFVGWANRYFSGGRSKGGQGTGYADGGVVGSRKPARFADGGVLGGIGDILAGAGDFFTGLFSDPAGAVKKLFAGVLGDGANTPGGGGWTDALKALPAKALEGVVATVKKWVADLGSMMVGGSGVQRWSGVVLQALSMVGQPASLLGVVLRRMNQESGGNPGAINLTDSNAAKGIPSKGLMQVIDPTFNSFAGPLRGLGVWNPLANIYASMRYAMSRYGSLAAAYNKVGGYDSGGIASGAGMMLKQTISPERILSPRQTKAFEALTPMLQSISRRGGSALPGYDWAASSGGSSMVGTINQYLPAGATAQDYANSMAFALRQQRTATGVHD